MFFRCALVQKAWPFVFSNMPIATLQGTTASLISRVNPWLDIENRVLFLGCRRMPLVFAVNVENGTDYGIMQVNPRPLAIRSISPTFYNGIFFVGEAIGGVLQRLIETAHAPPLSVMAGIDIFLLQRQVCRLWNTDLILLIAVKQYGNYCSSHIYSRRELTRDLG